MLLLSVFCVLMTCISQVKERLITKYWSKWNTSLRIVILFYRPISIHCQLWVLIQARGGINCPEMLKWVPRGHVMKCMPGGNAFPPPPPPPLASKVLCKDWQRWGCIFVILNFPYILMKLSIFSKWGKIIFICEKHGISKRFY